jgi:hypothetical protein
MQWEPIDYLGLVGGVLLLFAFWRVNNNKWKVSSPLYELDNVIASLILFFYTWQKHAYVSVVLNIVWAVVAFRGLSSYAQRRAMTNRSFARGFRRGKKRRAKL